MSVCTNEAEAKLLSELRVTELKQELEKRNLDKNGIKIILADRLEKAIKAEGHDPLTYKFHVNDPPSSDSPIITSKEEENVPNSIGLGQVCQDNPVNDSVEESTVTEKVEDKPAEEEANKEEPPQEEMLEDPLAETEEPTPSGEAVAEESKKSTPTEEKDAEKDAAARSLWVRGLTSATKAADLKALFTAQDKVVRAKIFTSKKQSSSTKQCFGYVTMISVAAADRCVAVLHKKMLKGCCISVEKADKTKIPKMNPSPAGPLNMTAASTTTSSSAAVAPATEESDSASATIAAVSTKKDDAAEDSGSKPQASGSKSSPAPKDKKESVKKDDKKDSSRRSRPRDTERIAHRTSGSDRREDRDRRIPRTDVRRREPQRSIALASSSSRYGGSSSTSFRGSRTMSHRISRPGDKIGGLLSRSSRRGPVDAWDRRDVFDIIQRNEEEHRRREQELELERERERIRFEREKLERERLELQLQAAMQQQQLSLSRSKEFAVPARPSSRNRTTEYRHSTTSRDRGNSSRDHSTSSAARSSRTSAATTQSADSRRPFTSSSSSSHRSGASERPASTTARTQRTGRDHRTSTTSSSRDRSRHDSYGTSASSRHTTTFGGRDYERGYTSSARETNPSAGVSSSSYYGSRGGTYPDGAYSARSPPDGAAPRPRTPTYSSRTTSYSARSPPPSSRTQNAWPNSASTSTSTYGANAWSAGTGASVPSSANGWNRTSSGAIENPWNYSGSSGSTGATSTNATGVRYDYDKYRRY